MLRVRDTSLSMAQGCAPIDSWLETAKIGSAGRLEVHRARFLPVGYEKRFPHGLGQQRTQTRKSRHYGGMSALARLPRLNIITRQHRFEMIANSGAPSLVEPRRTSRRLCSAQ
jgi:hypothetical protein